MMDKSGMLLGWALCANISDHLRGGVEPEKFYQGTRMFSPKTRVYLGHCYWGPGGEAIHVVGLRRVSRDWVNCVIPNEVLDNLRIASIYSSTLWARLERLEALQFRDKLTAEAELTLIQKAHNFSLAEKLRQEPYQDPWDKGERSTYRDSLE
jgi:hypothetical protein